MPQWRTTTSPRACPSYQIELAPKDTNRKTSLSPEMKGEGDKEKIIRKWACTVHREMLTFLSSSSNPPYKVGITRILPLRGGNTEHSEGGQLAVGQNFTPWKQAGNYSWDKSQRESLESHLCRHWEEQCRPGKLATVFCKEMTHALPQLPPSLSNSQSVATL